MIEIFENAMSGDISSKLDLELQKIIHSYHQEEYRKGYDLASKMYLQVESPQEKSILLHLICVFLENTYDLKLRSEWMAKWPLQIATDQSAFVKSAHQFHLAVSCYFESYYSEAESRFKQLLTMEGPRRFLGLAHLHLGLIYRNRQLLRGAQVEIRMALKIATEIDNKRLIKRSSYQLILLGGDMQFPLLNVKLRELIQNGDSKNARQLYLSKRKEEKSRGIQRERNCLHSFLPVFAAMRNHWNQVYKLLEYIPDYSMKSQTVNLILFLGRETPELKSLKKYFEGQLGINPMAQIQQTGEILFMGKSLKNIKSADLAKFALYLYENESVTKEGISQQVWNLNYDPVIHDGKIYKLIHQFRNYFGVKDVLVNRYGSYQINSRYRTSS